MKRLNTIIVVLTIGLSSLTAKAQQAPMYTHYMYNTLMINPAYAGSREALSITALHRSQWVNYKGAPITQTLTVHAPLKSEHIGIGLSASNDKIGPVNNTSVYADFAYIMKLTKKSKLSLGINGGINIFQASLSGLDLDQQGDAVFQNDIRNRTTPNFGVGAYYSRERFYAGFSIPALLENNYSSISQAGGVTLAAKEQRHYFFIAGAVFNLTENLAFKPTTFIKVTPAAPIQADVTASFILLKKLTLGAMFRTGDAFGALVGFDVSEQFHVGYSYDWSYGLKTSRYNQGSHEILMRYDFVFSGKKQIHSPRYF